MAANDEFPRGCNQVSGLAVNTAAGITYPAIPGISWVLTELDGSAYWDGAGNSNVTCDIAVNGVQYAVASEPSGPDFTGVTASWSGQVIFPPNTALTITWGTTSYQTLTASAYAV